MLTFNPDKTVFETPEILCALRAMVFYCASARAHPSLPIHSFGLDYAPKMIHIFFIIKKLNTQSAHLWFRWKGIFKEICVCIIHKKIVFSLVSHCLQFDRGLSDGPDQAHNRTQTTGVTRFIQTIIQIKCCVTHVFRESPKNTHAIARHIIYLRWTWFGFIHEEVRTV